MSNNKPLYVEDENKETSQQQQQLAKKNDIN